MLGNTTASVRATINEGWRGCHLLSLDRLAAVAAWLPGEPRLHHLRECRHAFIFLDRTWRVRKCCWTWRPLR